MERYEVSGLELAIGGLIELYSGEWDRHDAMPGLPWMVSEFRLAHSRSRLEP